jgi:hypothetical protein
METIVADMPERDLVNLEVAFNDPRVTDMVARAVGDES